MDYQLKIVMKKYSYYAEVIGVKRIIKFLICRLMRPLILKKDEMMRMYAEKAYARKIIIGKEKNKIPVGSLSYREKIDEFYNHFSLKINRYWHYCYSHINGIYSEKYIPEQNFYQDIEPCLNRAEMVDGYDDKNRYDRLFDNVKMPVCALRCINGIYYDHKYKALNSPEEILSTLDDHVEYIIKPSLKSKGGRDIFKIKKIDNLLYLDGKNVGVGSIMDVYKKDFVVQPFIDQHEKINSIYPYSLNTVRVMSLRLCGKILICCSFKRFGNSGLFTDNVASGGIAGGVLSNGTISEFAVDSSFQKYDKHPYTGRSFKGLEIPNIKEIYKLVKTQHHRLHYFDLASWDIAIGVDGEPILIEVNLNEQDINYLQLVNGSLFGEHTHKVPEKVYSLA